MRPKGDLDGSKPLFAGGEDDGRGVEDLLNKATLIDRFRTHTKVMSNWLTVLSADFCSTCGLNGGWVTIGRCDVVVRAVLVV